MTFYPQLFIFDLDGVLTDTAHYHYLAWKCLAGELGLYFDEIINERLKGVSRMDSFDIILEVNHATHCFSSEEKNRLVSKKNSLYIQFIEQITDDDILEGILPLLYAAKEKGIKLAVASASKNAFTVLNKLGIFPLFDYVSDANSIEHPKPHPEIFLDCSHKLNISPQSCIAFEDAEAGIMAIHAAHMFSVGINVNSKLIVPHLSLKSTSELNMVTIINAYNFKK